MNFIQPHQEFPPIRELLISLGIKIIYIILNILRILR